MAAMEGFDQTQTATFNRLFDQAAAAARTDTTQALDFRVDAIDVRYTAIIEEASAVSARISERLAVHEQ